MKKIVCFGDSITEGYMVSKEASYPTLLSRLLGVNCVNLGVSGDTSYDALKRLGELNEHLSTDEQVLVLVEFGINDFFMAVPAKECESNLEKIMGHIHSMGHRSVLLGFNMDYPGVPEWMKLYRRLSEKCNIPLYPNIFEGLSKREGDFLSDGLHPNESGYSKIASGVGNFLLKKNLL